ncbi:hypothetical protein [Citrobacter amalonaticus]|uniref:hypothetical protein n=1 Tax=Citrobacter amalonaticus TaxID=35703 RepID=UPI00300C0140
MSELNMNILNDSIKNQPGRVLNSFDEYCDWYLDLYDFSIFSEDEVVLALEEGKPNVYPCIPLVINNSPDIVFVDVNLVEFLYDSINSVRI